MSHLKKLACSVFVASSLLAASAQAVLPVETANRLIKNTVC